MLLLRRTLARFVLYSTLMKLVNFKIAGDSIALIASDNYFDLHNNYMDSWLCEVLEDDTSDMILIFPNDKQ